MKKMKVEELEDNEKNCKKKQNKISFVKKMSKFVWNISHVS